MMYYYGARYYSGRESIWLGVDPKADKSPNESPYAYCANNPIKFVDPDGQFKTWFGAAMYSLAHGGTIGGGKNCSEYFVGKPVPLNGSSANYQRRFDWNGRNHPKSNSEPRNGDLQKISNKFRQFDQNFVGHANGHSGTLKC
jgi:hypothetical protein